MFAQLTSRTGTLNGLPATTTSYFQHDQIGSITAITDGNGVVTERLAYDPWGKRRNIMTGPGTPDTRDLLVGRYTDRGFTEHQHLDEIGVIHMNGRVYDPLMGRFMSADPMIEAPNELASYNRYSYVWNNPLNRADPSGFCWICDPIGETTKTLNHIGDVIASDPIARTFVTVAIAYYTGQWATHSLGWGAIGSGALGGGAASAFSSNGDINAIAIGALTGAGFGAAGDVGVVSGANSFASYAAHASVGCVSAVAGGGNCGAGAASAVFGKYTTNALAGFGGPGVGGVIARGVVTVVAGGVGSVIAGGKFENGATTAAFGYLFNELLHQTSEYQRGEPHGSGLGSGTHWYDVENFACSTANSTCTTAAVDSLIKQYPAPAACAITSSCSPVKTGDESFALPVGSVRHTVSASLVINQTLPSHLLHDGMVMRSSVERNGAIYVRSLGFGTGRFPGPNVSNAKALWEAVDSRIRNKLP